jgi:hypothetical protein
MECVVILISREGEREILFHQDALDMTQVTIAWAGKTMRMMGSLTSILILGIRDSDE